MRYKLSPSCQTETSQHVLSEINNLASSSQQELTSLYNMKILIVLLAVMLVCSANSVERERDPEVLDSEVLDSDCE